jgi:Zn finger protein HypA/HybF involved in hydrogenase expression
VTITVAGADDWQAAVSEGPREWRLDYVCPTCNGANTIMLQPAPWKVPAEHVTEERRRAGNIKYNDVDELETQVWCHRCGQGVDVTVSRTA